MFFHSPFFFEVQGGHIFLRGGKFKNFSSTSVFYYGTSEDLF